MLLSENTTDADNQQERLVKIGWIIGFVDGEGCFSVGFIRQPDRGKRKGYKTGYQVWCEFAVTQGAKSLSVLEDMHQFFGVGNIYLNKRYDNHKEHMYRYVVRKVDDLEKVIIPFFEQYHLNTSKQYDFEKFAQCLRIIRNGEHLTHKGVADIAMIAQTMNRQKPRDYLIRILRDYTSNTHQNNKGVKI
jgi:LAGLIDADG endonuclease